MTGSTVTVFKLGCLIQLGANKFKPAGGPQTQLFFTCQDANASTDAAAWLRQLKKNLARHVFERMLEKRKDYEQAQLAEEVARSMREVASMGV